MSKYYINEGLPPEGKDEYNAGAGIGVPLERCYGDGRGYARVVKVVELTDECIERIADAVVRKMNEPKEEWTCGNCKWSVGKDKPETYVICKNKDRYIMPKAVDMFKKGCERWENDENKR